MPAAPPTANASGGMSPTMMPAPSSREHARFARGARDEIAVEGRGAADGVRFVERQRVNLHDARVGLERAEGDLAFDRQVEQPPRRGRADADARLGPPGEDRVDDFDDARGVAEAMPGNIEDEC